MKLDSLKIRNNLYRTKRFWLIKKWFADKVSFPFWVSLFKGDSYMGETRNSFSILRPTLLPFVATVLYSAFIVIVFQYYSYIFPSKIEFDGEAVNTFLATIASLAGVFLGLYFAAISGIASNFLLTATQDVRRFFITAPQGVQYVQTVALTGVVSVFYIIFKSFGYTVHPASLFFLLLITAYIVIRFWTVGSAVFNSLEPTDSLPRINKALFDLIKSVTSLSNFTWKKPALQNHQRKLATYQLTLFENLINFGLKSIRISNDQLIVAIRYAVYFLMFYSLQKRKIPTSSFWYKSKNKFESWGFVDSTAINIALHTGTSLQPKTIKDFTWFEEQVLNIVIKIFKSFEGEDRTNFLFQGLERFIEVTEIYGGDLDEAGIKMLFEKLETLTPQVYAQKIENIQDHSYKVQLAFVDTQGSIGVTTLLGFSKYLREQSPLRLKEEIQKINWLDECSIYKTNFPSGVLSRLESIASDLKNEKKIEGKILSPDWYIQTLVVQRYLFCVQGYFNFVKSIHVEYFQHNFEKLLSENQLSLAIQLIQRWREFTNKYTNLIYILKKHVEDCTEFHKVKDLPWVAFDFDKEIKEAQDKEKEATDKMVELLPKLSALVTGEDLPDYFGQALTMGVDACYEASKNDEPDRFNKIFPIVFEASLSAYNIALEKVQKWSEEESKLIYSTEPLINLFEISGYAKLYSELYQKPALWSPVEKSWDAYLARVNANMAIKFIAAISKYRDTIFKIMPQATLRANWQIEFEHKLREHGFAVFPDSDAYNAHDKKPNHQSPIIRIIVRSGGISMMTSARDIFFATYLGTKPESEGADLPDKHDIQERIQKEIEENNE